MLEGGDRVDVVTRPEPVAENHVDDSAGVFASQNRPGVSPRKSTSGARILMSAAESRFAIALTKPSAGVSVMCGSSFATQASVERPSSLRFGLRFART